MIDSDGKIIKSAKERPTYEEKLQALKESIVNWEETAKDLAFRSCPLCDLRNKYTKKGDCHRAECPISEKAGRAGCAGTPYWDFDRNPTKENALAEVVFLKNLYIEMLESHGQKSDKGGLPAGCCPDCEYWVDKGKGCNYDGECPRKPRPKKEEWVDVTEEVEMKWDKHGDLGYNIHLSHDGTWLAYLFDKGNAFNTCCGGSQKYRIEFHQGQIDTFFRILKKQ